MLLITGATGHVGRALVHELDARGADIRILARDLHRTADLPSRVERVTGDLTDPATLPRAMAGADRLFLLMPGIAVEPMGGILDAARAAGVNHIVYLSSYVVAAAEPVPAMGAWHDERERLIRVSGLPATFLRPSGFMTNAFDWLPTIREGGYVLDPVGPGRAAPIDPQDIAAVAAAELLAERPHEGAHLLTGDETFTVAEQVAVLSAATGRPLEVRAVASPEEAVRFRYPDGAPPALAAALVEGLRLMRADTTGLRTDTVREITGRKPRTFADWCARHAAAFTEAAH